MKMFLVATIVALSLVSIVPQASAICVTADPEVEAPAVGIVSLDPLQVEIDPGNVSPGVTITWGSC